MKSVPVIPEVCQMNEVLDLDELLSTHDTVHPSPYLRLVYERQQRELEDSWVPWDTELVEGLIY